MAISPLVTYGYAFHGDLLVAEQCVVRGLVGGSEMHDWLLHVFMCLLNLLIVYMLT